MADEHYDFSGIAVLIIDGSPFWTRVLKTILVCMRVDTIRCCPNAVEAWKEVQLWCPDVIFVDLAGERVDGLRFIRGVRRNDNPARCCPIILTSTVADAETVKRARNAGADYTIAKPVSLKVVYRALVALRDSERAFVQTKTYYGPDRRRRDRAFVGEDRRASAQMDAAVAASDDEPLSVLAERAARDAF